MQKPEFLVGNLTSICKLANITNWFHAAVHDIFVTHDEKIQNGI